MVDHGLAFGPLGSGIEGGGDVIGDHPRLVADAAGDNPVGVDDGAHEALELLERSAIELGVDASNPVGLGVGVDSLDDGAEVKGHLFGEQVHDVVV